MADDKKQDNITIDEQSYEEWTKAEREKADKEHEKEYNEVMARIRNKIKNGYVCEDDDDDDDYSKNWIIPKDEYWKLYAVLYVDAWEMCWEMVDKGYMHFGAVEVKADEYTHEDMMDHNSMLKREFEEQQNKDKKDE